MEYASSDSPSSTSAKNILSACQHAIIRGESHAIERVRQQLKQFACSDISIFIYGETGTGKELIAQTLHSLSPRRAQPFIPVNCGAYPNELILNELFGHERGAFTGASSRQDGLVSLAQEGTLFLDEVDSLSLSAQVVLLRFLQDKRYRPLGGGRELSSFARIVAATHCDLRERVADGRFREDLFYRLDVLRIELPPLRERREDILILARHFAEKFSELHQMPLPPMTPAFERWLMAYNWPGNVRELENVIVRWLFDQLPGSMTTVTDEAAMGLYVLEEIARHGALQMTLVEAKAQVIEEFERHYVACLLRLTNGNITHAARRAGKDRRAFGRLVKKYQLIN